MIIRYFVAVFALLLPAALHAAEWVEIPEGSFLMGSTPSQIEAAYRISAAGYGHEGVCRPAAFHARPLDLKHILIGFRLVEDIQTK